MQLGLHVHAAVNDEEFRLTGDEPQRQLQGLLPSPTTNGKGKNDELFRQRQASEVGRIHCRCGPPRGSIEGARV